LQALSEGNYNDNDWKLTYGAILVEKMRAAVYEKTGFRCSAGISNNKMLAKLACGMLLFLFFFFIMSLQNDFFFLIGINKPNKQTVLPFRSVEEFFTTFPLKKVRNLGGKLGLVLREEFHCSTMVDIVKIPERVLQERFDSKTG
jgi:DNA polymerase eta